MENMYSLDLNDQAIFSSLHAEPFHSANEIAKKLQLSPSTVISRIQRMSELGIIKSGNVTTDPLLGNRVQSEVLAEYDPRALQLTRHHIILENIHSSETIDKLNAFCDAHPYTHYRSVLFGGTTSYYIQFDVPAAISDEMRSVYNALSELLKLETPYVLNAENTVHSNPDFTLYGQFKLDQQLVLDILHKDNPQLHTFDGFWLDFIANMPSKGRVIERDVSAKMNQLDYVLLRELTINGKVSVKFLAEKYDKNKSVISRHLKKIKEQVISHGILRYDHNLVDMTSLQLIKGRVDAKSEMNISNLKQFIEGSKLPFESFLVTKNDDFLLYSTTTPRLSGELASFFWRKTMGEHFRTYQIDLNNSFGYYFYHHNIDDNGKWKIDREYYWDGPIKSIK